MGHAPLGICNCMRLNLVQYERLYTVVESNFSRAACIQAWSFMYSKYTCRNLFYNDLSVVPNWSLIFFTFLLVNGYIERKTVAEIYHHSNYSTFDFIKEESEYTLWEGKQQTRCIIIMRILVGASLSKPHTNKSTNSL